MQFYNMKIHLKPDEESKGMTTILMSALRHMLPIMHYMLSTCIAKSESNFGSSQVNDIITSIQ